MKCCSRKLASPLLVTFRILSRLGFAVGCCKDRAESDTVPLTQEFLSEMLGVRRTSVTEVAIKMQDAGAISYTRGIIKIVDLEKLKSISCECYEALRAKRRTSHLSFHSEGRSLTTKRPPFHSSIS